jgi:hypothetical protein
MHGITPQLLVSVSVTVLSHSVSEQHLKIRQESQISTFLRAVMWARLLSVKLYVTSKIQYYHSWNLDIAGDNVEFYLYSPNNINNIGLNLKIAENKVKHSE